MRMVGRVVAVALVGLTLAGCVTAQTDSAQGVPARLSGGEERWTSCAEAAPEVAEAGFKITAREAAALPRLDRDFIPVAVVICGLEAQRRPDGGQDLVATERRTEEVSALVTALRLADEPRPDGPVACTDEMPLAPWLALVDADGVWTRPGIPLDRCGKLRAEVREALGALPLVTVATRTIAELESAEAAAAGCAQHWKDMIAVHERLIPTPRPSALPELFPVGEQIRLCVYEVSKSEPGTGNFVHGTVLPADRRTAIERALRAAGPAESCSGPASRFALLWSTAGGDPETYVELDGCHRIMVVGWVLYSDGPFMAQGDAALAELIDKP
jgi:hypothetical protein